MKKFLFHKDLEVEVTFRRNVRAKRMILRVRQGEVILTIPSRARMYKALELLDEHVEWIKHKLLNYKNYENCKKVTYKHGSIISLFDKEYVLQYTGNLRGGIYFADNVDNVGNIDNADNNMIIVNGKADTSEVRIQKFLASFLKETIVAITNKLCDKIQVSYKEIHVRKMTTKWGSCTSSHSLSFSTKLVFAPYWVLEYVVAHEVCHIKEFNHSARFWSLVESICPDWRVAKTWLKNNGIALG